MIGAFGTGLDAGIVGDAPGSCPCGEGDRDDDCDALVDSRKSRGLDAVAGTVGMAAFEDTEDADPSACSFTGGMPPDCVTSFCGGALVRAVDPARPGNRTRRPQREHGLLLTSHSLPQRGQVMICPSL